MRFAEILGQLAPLVTIVIVVISILGKRKKPHQLPTQSVLKSDDWVEVTATLLDDHLQAQQSADEQQYGYDFSGVNAETFGGEVKQKQAAQKLVEKLLKLSSTTAGKHVISYPANGGRHTQVVDEETVQALRQNPIIYVYKHNSSVFLTAEQYAHKDTIKSKSSGNTVVIVIFVVFFLMVFLSLMIQ